MQEQGPVPAKTFYGAVDPSTALKIIKGVPMFKAVFAPCVPEDAFNETSKEQSSKKQNRGKTCTAHFRCRNISVFSEDSGTLFCRDLKPKSVPTKFFVSSTCMLTVV